MEYTFEKIQLKITQAIKKGTKEKKIPQQSSAGDYKNRRTMMIIIENIPYEYSVDEDSIGS